MKESYELGKQGEELAVNYLEKRGYQIIDRRWRDHHMEIDIVAYDPEAEEIVSIEVKTRESADWGEPEDAIDDKKIRRMVYATDYYLKEKQISAPVRFDFFAIVIPKNGDPTIDHIKDAFYPPLG